MKNDDLLKEPNIFKCTVKKTTSVFLRHILYASYVIIALAVIGIGYLTATKILIPIALPFIVALIAVLLSIPWYWYVILGIPVAYVGYGYFWCVARRLTEEDWKSKSGDNFVAFITIFAFVAFVTIIGYLGAFFAPITVFILAFAAFAVFISAFFFAFRMPDDEGVVLYYGFRFIGAAWHHYRKQRGS